MKNVDDRFPNNPLDQLIRDTREKTPEQRINDLHTEIKEHISSALETAVEIGKLLIEQKSELEHGAWLPWIEKNLVFGREQATKYMKLFEKRELLSNVASTQHLGIESALKEIRRAEKGDKSAPSAKEFPIRVREERNVLYLDPAEEILLTFNKKVPADSQADYEKFKQYMIKAAEKFFQRYDKEILHSR